MDDPILSPAIQGWTRRVYFVLADKIISTGTVHGGVNDFVNIDPDDLSRYLTDGDVEHIKNLKSLNMGLRFDKFSGTYSNVWSDFTPSETLAEIKIVCKTSFDIGIAGERYKNLTGDDSLIS